MAQRMANKIDTVLDQVKEPESGLTIAQIGLVEKVRYVEASRKLYVIKRPVRPAKQCCKITANLLLTSTLKDLQAAFEKAFPDLTVEIV